MLGGADFGAGFWSLLGRRGEQGEALRDHAHHAMGPVWEANHVWLIFVLVVCWTALPDRVRVDLSTLAVPLFIAAVGDHPARHRLRAARGHRHARCELRAVDLVFALSSILVAVRARRRDRRRSPRAASRSGTRRATSFSSWLNPTSLLVGVLAVAVAAYLAAVYLAADAKRLELPELAEAFRVRALADRRGRGRRRDGAACSSSATTRAAIWDGLTSGAGLGAVVVSACAGAATMLLVWTRRYGPARATAAAAVAAVLVGWVLAQRPELLPGLSIHEAAAGRSTLVALVIATVIGAVLLVPSLVDPLRPAARRPLRRRAEERRAARSRPPRARARSCSRPPRRCSVSACR